MSENRFYPIPAAARMLSVNEDVLKRLVAHNAVTTRSSPNGIQLIDLPEAATILGADVSDPIDSETATLALLIRRIKKIDIEIQQKTLDYQTRTAQVMPSEVVRQERLKRIRVVRTALSALPRGVAYRLTGEPVEKIESILTQEITKIMDMFSRGEDGVDEGRTRSLEAAGLDKGERIRDDSVPE